jgi:carboxylate-amine ligase
MPIEFKEGGSGYSLGVEEELHIVDATTGELVQKIEEIMSRLPNELHEFVSYELFQSVMEIKTPPCASVAEVEKHLRELRGRVGSWAAACGASLASAGTHPFSRYRDQKVTDQERYKNVLKTLRWIAQREVIFGQHVHVAVPGPQEAIIAHESFPRAGLPPAFPDYEAFEGYVELMVESGAMEDYTYCWWDVRPHAKIGTIELRVLDSQTSLKDTVALTALTQCVVAEVLEEVGPHEPYNMHLAVENKFRASRYGMDAEFYDAHDKTTVPARDLARNLVERLRPHAQDLGCESELEGVLEIVESGTGSQRQREVHKESGNFLDVVAFLIEGTRPAFAEEQS